MWEKFDAHWQRLIWGRKNRRNHQGEILFQEVRIDLRNVTTGEIINLTATAPPEGDLEREIDLAVQRHVALRRAAGVTHPEMEDLLREKQRLEEELATVVLRLEQARRPAEVKAASTLEDLGSEPS